VHKFQAEHAAKLLREQVQKILTKNVNDIYDDDIIRAIKQATENTLSDLGNTHIADMSHHVDIEVTLHPSDELKYTIMFKPLSLTGARIIHEWYQVIDMMEIMRP
jgi:hypothetical protein